MSLCQMQTEVGFEMSDENCHGSRKHGQSGMIEGIGFAGFRRKKMEGEHGKLFTNRAIKRTEINCSLVL